MPVSAAAQRRRSLAALLEVPSEGAWGVSLSYIDGRSDKEYRVFAKGCRVVFSWGRHGAAGEIQELERPSAEVAHKDAVKRWSQKEAKGYWPTTGIVRLDELPRTALAARHELAAAYRSRFSELADPNRLVGDEIFLVQTPPYESFVRGAHTIVELAQAGQLVPAGVVQVVSGMLCLVGVNADGADLLRQLCPVAVHLGARDGQSTLALAEVATTIASDAGADSEPIRLRLDRAIEMARLVLG